MASRGVRKSRSVPALARRRWLGQDWAMVKYALEILILPPVNLALVALVALVLRRRAVALVALLAVLVLALPVVADQLIWRLEQGLPEVLADRSVPQAIVILSAETERLAAAPGGLLPVATDVGPLTLERLRAGMLLARRTGLPVLTSGGVINRTVGPDGFQEPPVAAVMARVLADDWQVPVRWQETASADTWQNAANSAVLLRAAGISKVYVVTHAWHERRALVAFAAAGIEAVAAPVRWDLRPDPGVGDFVPRATAWLRSYYAVHEWVGWAWYRWRRG